MEHYLVSARKYRPSTFATVIGQKPLTAALKHAIATDRLAHAYLFCGSRGVGKTSCARIFAKTINCEHRTPDGEACNQCESCRAFNDNNSLNIIELDAASHNGIDDIKSLIEQVMVPPTQGHYRVFIIDEVHMLSQAAFNAFLKTLEEPPSYVIFILATTEKHKIIPTILSRCQIYDFSRITIQDMVEHLQMVAANEGITAEPSALNVIARKADGAMRDALSIFDQVAASAMGNVTYQNTIDNLNILDSTYYARLVEAFLQGDVPTALLIYKEVREKGFDSQFFINGLSQYLRDLMVAMQPSTLPLLEASDEIKAEMAKVAAKCAPTFIYRAMALCNDADLNFRVATNKQFLIELTLVKLCQLCSPSPSSGVGEGQLKPIAARNAQPATAPQQAPAQPAAAPQAAEPQARTAPAPAVAPAQSAPSPAPAAVSNHQPAATTPRRTSMTLSLKGIQNRRNPAPDQAAEAEAAYNPTAHRAEAYTDQALTDLWKAYIAAHPTERILVNTMMTAEPTKVGPDRYTITVDDQIQIDTYNQAKADLMKYLRDGLRNDSVTVDVVLSQAVAAPVTWTQREVLQHMIETNPALTDFIKTFTLTLS